MGQNVQGLLDKNFIRFEWIEDNKVKIGAERSFKVPEAFVASVVKYLLQSSMSGFVFIGMKIPLLKELAKVDYSKLHRL